MKPVIISLFAIGWIDMLNPTGISIVMLLVQTVKKRQHALLHVIFSYIAYASGGIAIFFGVDRFLKDFYIKLCSTYPFQTSIAKFCIGVLCIIGFILMTSYLIRSAVKKRPLSLNDMLKIKSVSPAFIIFFAFASTWSVIFGSVTLLGFIGVLIANDITLSTAVFMIPLYCLFSVVPTLTVYILYSKDRSEKLQKILNTVKKIMTTFLFCCVPVIFALGTWWGLKESIPLLFKL